MKADRYSMHIRRTTVCGSVHPTGGFVAWPERQTDSVEEKEMYELLKRRRERRGYVAWPAKTESNNKVGVVSGAMC